MYQHNRNRRSAAHYTRVQREVAEKIEKNGYTLISVFDSEAGVQFAYTVGLEHSFEHPEFLILDASLELAQEFLTGLAALVSEGRYFRPGPMPPDLTVHPPLCFYRVARRHYRDYLNVGCWFYRGEDFRALQIVPAPAKIEFHQILDDREL